MIKLLSFFSLFAGLLVSFASNAMTQKVRTYYGPGECHSSVAASATSDGFKYSDKGDYEKALSAYE